MWPRSVFETQFLKFFPSRFCDVINEREYFWIWCRSTDHESNLVTGLVTDTVEKCRNSSYFVGTGGMSKGPPEVMFFLVLKATLIISWSRCRSGGCGFESRRPRLQDKDLRRLKRSSDRECRRKCQSSGPESTAIDPSRGEPSAHRCHRRLAFEKVSSALFSGPSEPLIRPTQRPTNQSRGGPR
jgi:hypothetical protein